VAQDRPHEEVRVQHRRPADMDILFLLLMAALAGLTWGGIILCERLRK
jgi:hypothetical protein